MNNTSIFTLMHLIAGNVWIYGGSFLVVLGVLVFVHEWGHYIVARLYGVRIETFSVGFGPELFGHTAKNGTRWKLSAVPLGGYVKMFGDTDPASAGHTGDVGDGETARPMTGEERKVAFFAQPVWKRAAIVIAGPAVNFIFAIAVFAGIYTFYGEPVTQPIVAAVIAGSPAEVAGFWPHDRIEAIDGKAIRRFDDIRLEVMIGLDKSRNFTVLRDGHTFTIAATPRREVERDHLGFRHETATLGLLSPGNGIEIKQITAIDGRAVTSAEATRAALRASFGKLTHITLKGDAPNNEVIARAVAADNPDFATTGKPNFDHLILATPGDVFTKHPMGESLADGTRQCWDLTAGTLRAVGQIIVGTRSARELGGIVQIGAMAGDVAKLGIVALLSFAAMVSINLGLINLFPIPMLDGGHLLFYAVETLKGSPIPERGQEFAFRVGLAIIVGLMLFSNINGIMQLIL